MTSTPIVKVTSRTGLLPLPAPRQQAYPVQPFGITLWSGPPSCLTLSSSFLFIIYDIPTNAAAAAAAVAAVVIVVVPVVGVVGVVVAAAAVADTNAVANAAVGAAG